MKPVCHRSKGRPPRQAQAGDERTDNILGTGEDRRGDKAAHAIEAESVVARHQLLKHHVNRCLRVTPPPRARPHPPMSAHQPRMQVEATGTE
jgi:hypothetical protein